MSNIWRLNKFYGGISTSSKRGIDGAVSWLQGNNFRDDPDLLQPNLAMSKVSSTNVTGLVKWFTHYDKAGTITYYAIDDGGKIYSSASNWTSLQTTANCSGQGLAVFNNYLYYAQNAQLGRYGDLSGSPSFTDNYQVLNSDTLWHPLKVFLNKLCVGNGRTLATLDDTATWTSAAITLPIGWKIKCLEVKGDFLYIGAWKGTNITDFEEGAIFAWDGTSTTWNSVEFINESGVNAMLNYNDTLFIWAGTRGNIYQYANGIFYKIKKVPFIGYGKTSEVYPGAVASFNGFPHFGGAGSTTSTTMYNGVYTWGQAEKNYPMVLNYDYPISTGTLRGSTLAIGAIYAASPTKLYVGWKDGSTYGIDLINQSTALTFTGSLALAAVSATLTGNWTGTTGYYTVSFSNGDERQVLLTNGATTATWTPGLSGTATTAATAAGATQSQTVVESLIYDGNEPYKSKQAKFVKITYAPFVGTESITVKYKLDRAATWTTLSDATEPWDTTSFNILPFKTDDLSANSGFFRWKEIQIRLELNNGAST